MDLTVLFGSKAKVDILKYLVFKREWVSMRQLETVLRWSFPAIKKQVDILSRGNILDIEKKGNKWQIYIKENIKGILKELLFTWFFLDFQRVVEEYDYIVEDYFFCDFFVGSTVGVDIVIVYKKVDNAFLDEIKKAIETFHKWFFVDDCKIAFMLQAEYERRQRLADRFVVELMNIKQKMAKIYK